LPGNSPTRKAYWPGLPKAPSDEFPKNFRSFLICADPRDSALFVFQCALSRLPQLPCFSTRSNKEDLMHWPTTRTLIAVATAAALSFASIAGAQTSPSQTEMRSDRVSIAACSSANIEREAWLAAITAAAEARGERDADLAMELVLAVIGNRVCARHMGDDTIEKVVTRSWQFSAWNADSPMRSDLSLLTQGLRAKNSDLEAAARRMLPVARDMIAGTRPKKLPSNVLHYAALDDCDPSWAEGATVYLVFGHHTFFSNVR
jgi:hypothetical protein